MIIWLVVYLPLWKIWLRQLGLLVPIYGKIIQSCSSHHQAEMHHIPMIFAPPPYDHPLPWANDSHVLNVAHRFSFSENRVPSGKRLHNYGKSPFLMGKSTISMAIFNSYVKLPEGTPFHPMLDHNCPNYYTYHRLELYNTLFRQTQISWYHH